ncbi:MAG: hypothetical protein FJ137_09595 [Deltaproteobacteria bacterium]|nr:hypothetical protein [Deltaproteobacteria bacterium]
MAAPRGSFFFVAVLVTVTLTGACGPTPECRAFVACQRAVDDDVDLTTWDEGGACWRSSAGVAATCTAQCQEALAALQEIPDAPAACFD